MQSSVTCFAAHALNLGRTKPALTLMMLTHALTQAFRRFSLMIAAIATCFAIVAGTKFGKGVTYDVAGVY
jgi:hypothetical protein